MIQGKILSGRGALLESPLHQFMMNGINMSSTEELAQQHLFANKIRIVSRKSIEISRVRKVVLHAHLRLTFGLKKFIFSIVIAIPAHYSVSTNSQTRSVPSC